MVGRPELFPALLRKLQSPDILTTQRVYLVLNQTLKELSTKRLAADQRNFAEVCILNVLRVYFLVENVCQMSSEIVVMFWVEL